MSILGDDIRHALPVLRDAADSVLVDRATVTRPGAGAPVLNPTTGEMTPPAATTIYTNRPCRLRQPTAQEATVLFGEELVTTTRFVVDFHWTTTSINIGDTITITASADADALAAELRVVAGAANTYPVFKSIGCKVVE